MKPRPVDEDEADARVFHARRFLEAVAAVAPFAVRLLTEGVTGQDGHARDEAVAFLVSRYFEGPRSQQDACLALGVAVGLHLHVSASDLEVARSSLAAADRGLIAAVAEKVTVRRRAYSWKCDEGVSVPATRARTTAPTRQPPASTRRLRE